MTAAAIKKLTTKRKKPEPKPLPQRKSGTAKFLEEKHIGSEVKDWSTVTNVESAVYQTLRHYNYFYDHKDAFQWAMNWVQVHRPADLAAFKASDDWRVNTAVGGICKMHMMGAPFNEGRLTWLNKKIDEVVAVGRVNLSNQKPPAAQRSASDILKEKTNSFLAEVEHVIDMYIDSKTFVDAENYSVFNELKKIGANKATAQKVYDYYTPLRDELTELVSKKTPDLVEGYRHLKTVKERKDYLAFVQAILDDCQRFMNAVSATKVRAPRTPRVKKKVPVEKLIARVKYQKESIEYKLTSVDPANIVGAKEAYIFNTKYRVLSRIVSDHDEGLSIKGTTIVNFNEESSTRKTIRKPEDVLKEFGQTTKARIARVFEDLKTKASPANGRLNEETVIVKAFK